MTKDKQIRSVTKTITWRVIATISTAIFVFLYTHKMDLAFMIGGWTAIANVILYYFHERVWENIAWGRITIKKKK